MLISCSTVEYVPLEPSYPELKKIENIVDTNTLNEIRKPLDLIPEPKTVSELVYNATAYRSAYISWRTYATALETYYNKVIDALTSKGE